MSLARKSRVLFVGGGRRIGLAKKFVEHGAALYGYEACGEVPLQAFATIIEGCDFDDPEIADDLRLVIKKHKITHVVPLMDAATMACGDLPECIGSSWDAARLCYDKSAFARWMEDRYAAHYPSPGFMRYPKLAKPRFGRSSRGVVELHRPSIYEWSSDYVVQDYVDGLEVSVDVFLGPVQAFAVARTRDRVEGGEVVESTVLGDDAQEIREASVVICRDMGLRGPVNVQWRADKVIEINARFGGGCVLTIASGLDMVGLCLGKKVKVGAVSVGMTMRRFYSEAYW